MGMRTLEMSHEEGENHGLNCVWTVSQRAMASRALPSCLCAPRASAAERQPQRQRPLRGPDGARVLVGIGKQECEGNKPAGGARGVLSILTAIQSPAPRRAAATALRPETPESRTALCSDAV